MSATPWAVGGALGTVLGAGLGALVGGKAARWEGAGLGALVGGAVGSLAGGGLDYAGAFTPSVASLPSAVKRAACHPYTAQAGDSIVLVGDSIGVGLSPFLKAALNKRLPNVAFISAAVESDDAAKTLERIKSLSLHGLAIVSLGSNDAAGNPTSSAIGEVTARLATEGARVMWVPGPNFTSNPPPPATKAKQAAFLATVRKDPRAELMLPSGEVASHLTGDRIHLDPTGYEMLANEILACLGLGGTTA